MSYKGAADVRAVGDALRSIRNVGDVHVKQSAEVLGEERASIKERGQRCAGTRRVDGVASMASRRWRDSSYAIYALSRWRGGRIPTSTPSPRPSRRSHAEEDGRRTQTKRQELGEDDDHAPRI